MSQAPNSTPMPARTAKWPADEADHHHGPREQSGSPHQVAEEDPIAEPGAELWAEKGGLVMHGEQPPGNVNESPIGASGPGEGLGAGSRPTSG